MLNQSLNSQVDQVRALLSDLQNRLIDLPAEIKTQVSAELEQYAHEIRSTANTTPPNHLNLIIEQSAQGIGQQTAPMFDISDPWLGIALRQASSGAWRWDLLHNKTQWSPELYDLLGYSLDTDISAPQAFVNMIHPDDRIEKAAEIREALDRGGPFYIEFRIHCGDGRQIWLSSAGTVQKDAFGRSIIASGVSQDITARKMAEEALLASQEREKAKAAEMEALMDVVPAMIWISRDPHCQEMIGNRYGYEFLKLWQGANLSKTANEQDLSQQPYRNFKDGREVPSHELPMQIAASTGVGANNYEFDLVFNNGETKNLFGNVSPLFDASGRPSGAVAAFVDITERKRAEENIRKNEARLTAWKEQLSFWSKATNSFFWVLEPDGSYQNQNLIDPYITGKSFEQTQGWKWMEAIHPEDQVKMRQHWQDAIQRQSTFNAEVRLWHQATQDYRWFMHKAVPIISEGEIKGWVGASMDNHERKEIEDALKTREAELSRIVAKERAQAAELQAIMDAVPTPIILTRDPEGSEIVGNRVAYQILRAKSGENLKNYLFGEPGSKIIKNVHNGSQRSTRTIPILTALHTGKPVKDFEGSITFTDGSEVVLYGNATPLLDGSGKPFGAVGVFMDITQRIADVRDLRDSEQRFRVALASAPITVFAMDKNLRYTWSYNPRHNFSIRQLIGKRDDEINTPENVSELLEAKRWVIETGQPLNRDISILVDGELFSYIVSLDPILGRQGQVDGLVGAAFDITKQRNLEAVARDHEIQIATQRHLLATRENERLTIAREIHDGPIQTIVSTMFHVQNIKEQVADQVGKAELDQIGTSLKSAVQELRQLINELRPPTLVRFGLVKAIERLIADTQEKSPGLELTFRLSNVLGTLTEVNSLGLYRICQEALNNILRHSKATQAGIYLSTEENQIILRIKDNGTGFSTAIDLSKLTEENHFGMAGMKERAEALGGDLTVTSTPGAGTSIEVKIPYIPF